MGIQKLDYIMQSSAEGSRETKTTIIEVT